MIRRSPTRRAVTAVAAAALLFTTLLAGCGPADPLAEARRLQATGNFAGSIEPLRLLLEERPDDGEANYLYGVALVRIGQASVAMWPLRRAAQDPEWLIPANLELATSELRSQNYEEAIAAAGRILEVEPDHIDTLLFRSRARSQSRRDYEGALVDADRVLELDPDNLLALAPRSVALLGLGRIEEAEVAIDALEERHREGDLGTNGNERYCVSRALFASEKGDTEIADQLFSDCLERFPKGYSVISEALKFYDSLGRFDRSIEVLREALAGEPKSSVVREGLAQRLSEGGKREEAERLLLAGTELENPQLAFSAWIALSNHYADNEKYAEAVSALDQAMDLADEPGSDLVLRYADLLVLAGQYERAEEVANGIEVPAHREIILGRIHLEQGRPAEALERLSAGLVFWPDNAVARYYAAIAAERLGDIDRAVSELRYSIRADVTATDARLRLGRLHQAEGAYEHAMTAAGHRGGEVPLDSELELFWLGVRARGGWINAENAHRSLIENSSENPGNQIAAMAEGARVRGGPGAAARLVRAVPKLDLTNPRNAAALRVLVVDLIATNRVADALSQVEAGLALHPEAADLQALRGLALEADGVRDGARAAFEQALASGSENPVALAGLARARVAAGDVDAALALYARATAADADRPEPQRAAAELLVANGRREEAEAMLTQLLIDHPYDAAAATRLGELRLDRDADSEHTLALARRAVRFQGGPDAFELLARVHTQRGEPDLADEAKQRAESARTTGPKPVPGSHAEP